MKELTTNREGDTAISKPSSEVFSLWQWIIVDASGEDASVVWNDEIFPIRKSVCYVSDFLVLFFWLFFSPLVFKSLFHFPIKMSKSLQWPVKLFRSLDMFLQPGTDSCFPGSPVLLARDVWTRSNPETFQTRLMTLLSQQSSLALLQPGCWTRMALCLDRLDDGQSRVSQIDQNNRWSFLRFPLWSRRFPSWVLLNATFRAENKVNK